MMQSKNLTSALQEILQIFPCVTEERLLLYMKKNLGVGDPEEEFRKLIHNNRLYRDDMHYCYIIKGVPQSVSSACAFAVYQALAKGNTFHANQGRHPYDYIFGVDKKNYLLMNFGKDGLYRLGYEQNMYHPDLPEEFRPVPVIMLINDRISSVPEALVPENTLFALVRFEDNQVKGVNFISHKEKESPH